MSEWVFAFMHIDINYDNNIQILTKKDKRISNMNELMAQPVRASLSDVCRAEHAFDAGSSPSLFR